MEDLSNILEVEPTALVSPGCEGEVEYLGGHGVWL